MGEYNIVELVILCTVIFIGVLVWIIWGEANFDRVILTGPYEVGHMDIYMKNTGNAVSVYYPMDKDEHKRIMD